MASFGIGSDFDTLSGCLPPSRICSSARLNSRGTQQLRPRGARGQSRDHARRCDQPGRVDAARALLSRTAPVRGRGGSARDGARTESVEHDCAQPPQRSDSAARDGAAGGRGRERIRAARLRRARPPRAGRCRRARSARSSRPSCCRVNEQRTSVRIVEARTRAGQSGSKLFHRNSYHARTSGHIYAYHHGGRWEPQFNIGLFSGRHGAATGCESDLDSTSTGRPGRRGRSAGRSEMVR